MKTRFFIFMFFIVCINVDSFAINDTIDTIPHDCSCPVGYLDTLMECPNLKDITISDYISYITALINALNNAISIQNNNLTLITIIIGIIGLVIAIAGFWSHRDLKEDIKEYKKRIDKDHKGFEDEINTVIRDCKNEINVDINSIKKELQEKIEEINLLKDDVVEKTKEIDELTKKQEFQNQYLQRINECLFSITNSVVDNYGGDNERALGIRKNFYHQYYIVKIFLPWSDGTEAAFRYLQANGTQDNIEDLQLIANKDPDDRKRKIALETIGYIRARSMNGQAS